MKTDIVRVAPPHNLDAATVRAAAQGRWSIILPALNINVPNHPRKHGPCPTCGGKDRFRFDDRDGTGTWFCNQCEQKAGDGLALVMRVLNRSFPETLRTVASVLGLDPTQGAKSRQPIPPAPVRVDWRAQAFACELAALDRRSRADGVFRALSKVADEDLSAAVQDRLMMVACLAHDDLEQAERLEYLADLLRAKDFDERKHDGA